MKKIYLFLITLSTLLGTFTNLHAQEPSELGNYRITKIGTPFEISAQTPLPEGQWFLMGRSQELKDTYGDGYVYENILSGSTPIDWTYKIENATCSAGSDNGAVPNWNLTQTGSTNGVLQVNKHSDNHGLGAYPYAEYWVYNKAAVLSDATISHDQITELTPGMYEISVTACMYSEHEDGTFTSPNPTGISFYAEGTSRNSVALTTGTAIDGYGYYGTYTIQVEVGTAGTLDFGFQVVSATCNWLAFKNITLKQLPIENVTNSVTNNLPNSGSAGTTRYVLTSTLTAGDEYLIVSRNTNGSGYALGHSGTTVASDDVTVKANGSTIYIDASDVDDTSVWTVTGTNNTYTFKNGTYYIRYNSGLTISTTSTSWTWSTNNNRLSYKSGRDTYYIRYNNDQFSTTTTRSSVYLFKKETIPPSLDNWSTTEYTLSLQNGNARYDLGDSWTGNAGDLYNDGNVFANATTVSHDQVTRLENGRYQISVDARVATEAYDGVFNGYFYGSSTGGDGNLTIANANYQDILSSIGASSANDFDVLYQLPDGTLADLYTSGGGWHAADENFIAWGDGAAFYLQASEWYEDDLGYGNGTTRIEGQYGKKYKFGRYNTSSAVTYTAHLVYKHKTNGKAALLTLTLCYGNSIEFNYQFNSPIGSRYEGKQLVVDRDAILASIGADDMSNVNIYYELPNGDRVEGTLSDTDGWHAADGTFTGWGNNSVYYIQEFHEKNPGDNAYESGQCFIVGGYPEATNVPATYSGKIIYKNTTTNAVAVVNIRLVYTGILAKFYAGDQQIDLSTGSKYNGTGYNGYSGTYTLNVSVVEQTLNFGFDIFNAHWLSFKNVKLYRLGDLNPIRMSDNERPGVGDIASDEDVRKYLVRFAKRGEGTNATESRLFYSVQFGTGNYLGLPYEEGGTVEVSTSPANYFIYMGFGYNNGDWKISKDGVFFNSTSDGTAWGYLLQADGPGNPLHTYLSGGSASTWDYNPSEDNYLGDRLFTLYPLTLGETSPTVPGDVTLPETSTKNEPKFYKLKNKVTGDYATYTDIIGHYYIMGRESGSLTGSSYWWFEDEGVTGDPYLSTSKRVRIHNVMQTDINYGKEIDHCEDLNLISVPQGMGEGDEGSYYYLFPATVDGTTGFAIARSEYSMVQDAWNNYDNVITEIGQHSAMSEVPYSESARTLWECEEVSAAVVWNDVVSTTKESLHAGSYFSPSEAAVKSLYDDDYEVRTVTANNFFSQLESLNAATYSMCNSAEVHDLAPDKGGRFYFKNYGAPTHYFAYNEGGFAITEELTANNVWELMPFSDPTLIVRVDDQPRNNDSFNSWYYAYELPHKPLQRFWVRNRAHGAFLTHAPRDKSVFEKISDGIWNMNLPSTSRGYDAWHEHGDNMAIDTVSNLNRENADLWYLDVVTNPRTGIRTGVLRTLFCYDYGPWDGCTSSEGPEGDAIAGYNYPVVRWNLNDKTMMAAGVTFTDADKAFSQWVIYDIDTDLPETGVNYTLKNKQTEQYVFWDGEKLDNIESVESLSDRVPTDDPNRGVWMLTSGDTPHLQNVWAANTTEQTNKNLLIQSPATLGPTGSAVYIKKSNVDPKGVAISNNPAEPEAENDYYFKATESGDNAYTKGKSKNDYAVFSIDKVDRLYDDVVYDLNKMLGNLTDGTSIFYVKKDAVTGYNSQITAWNNYVDAVRSDGVTADLQKEEYPTYKTIKDLVNGQIGDKNFVMPIKDVADTRYLIRNKETGRYLTDLGQLITVDSTEVSHYSIWDLAYRTTESETRYLYTLTNEGANFVMDGVGGETHTKNYKHMIFDDNAGDYGFQMGTSGTELHFRPDGEGYARLHYYVSGDKDMDNDKVLYDSTWCDHIVQSKVKRVNNVYWEVIPASKFFTNARTLDKFKTEVGLVKAEALAMGGYSGGPLTLEESDMSGIAGNLLTALRTDIVGTSSVDSEGGAKTWGTLMNRIWNFDSTLPGDEPLYLLKWKPGFEVYLETVFRPTAKQRLTTGSGSEAWTTSTTQDDSDNRQTFEFEEAATSSGKYYLKNRNTSRYLGKSTTDDGDVTSVSDKTDAAQLEVKEIVPGIYSMEDGSNRFLSISEDGNVVWAPACGYGALWRIHCFNYIQRTGSKITGTSDLWQGKYVRTFRSPTDTRVKVSDGMKVYYGKNETGAASGKTTRERTDGTTERQVSLTFNEVTADGDGLLNMEGGESYILVKDEQLAKDDIKVWSKYMGSESILGQNLLSSQVESFTITSDNQKNVFALNYITPGTPIGSIGGQQVTAFGVGFYPLRVGAAVPAYTPFLSSTTISTAISELREAINGDKASSVKGEVDVPSIQIVFKNNDGTSDRIEVPIATDNTEDMGPVYDLSGRKVADRLSNVSKRGMYIVNGQKVLRK